MIKALSPAWLTGFLLQEKLPYYRLTLERDRNDNSLVPVAVDVWEGVPLKKLVAAAQHSNPSILSSQLHVSAADPARLVPVPRMVSWLLRWQGPLGKRFRQYYTGNLHHLQAGNFHLVQVPNATQDAGIRAQGADGTGRRAAAG